jgi:hypothetical protein
MNEGWSKKAECDTTNKAFQYTTVTFNFKNKVQCIQLPFASSSNCTLISFSASVYIFEDQNTQRKQ